MLQMRESFLDVMMNVCDALSLSLSQTNDVSLRALQGEIGVHMGEE